MYMHMYFLTYSTQWVFNLRFYIFSSNLEKPQTFLFLYFSFTVSTPGILTIHAGSSHLFLKSSQLLIPDTFHMMPGPLGLTLLPSYGHLLPLLPAWPQMLHRHSLKIPLDSISWLPVALQKYRTVTPVRQIFAQWEMRAIG